MKHITIEKVVLFLAAGFAAYNFGMVGGYIEHGEAGHFSIGGLVAGVVVNISLAIAASRYGSLNGAKRTKQAQIAFTAMLVLSPVLVSPVVFYSLPETFLHIPHEDIWWINLLANTPRLLWSLAWPLVADLAIVLSGAVSGKGLIALSEPTAPQSTASAVGSAQTAPAVRKGVRRSADAVRTECAELSAQYACTEPQCAWSPSVDALVESARAGKSPKTAAASAKAGHVKNKHPKPIVLDQSLLISKDGER